MTEFVPGGGDDELTIPPDTYTESDEFTTWPVGYSIMVVTSGANWGPNTGEAGIVTTKSAGTEGIQTFEAYNGSTYKRAYTDDAWSAWAEAGGGGGGGDVTNLENLVSDSRLTTSLLSAFPYGQSIMASSDFGITDSFADWQEEGYLVTERYLRVQEGEADWDEGRQIYYAYDNKIYVRRWTSGSGVWGASWLRIPIFTEDELQAVEGSTSPSFENPFLTFSGTVGLFYTIDQVYTKAEIDAMLA